MCSNLFFWKSLSKSTNKLSLTTTYLVPGILGTIRVSSVRCDPIHLPLGAGKASTGPGREPYRSKNKANHQVGPHRWPSGCLCPIDSQLLTQFTCAGAQSQHSSNRDYGYVNTQTKRLLRLVTCESSRERARLPSGRSEERCNSFRTIPALFYSSPISRFPGDSTSRTSTVCNAPRAARRIKGDLVH